MPGRLPEESREAGIGQVHACDALLIIHLYLSISVYLSVYISIYLFIYLSIYLYIYDRAV